MASFAVLAFLLGALGNDSAAIDRLVPREEEAVDWEEECFLPGEPGRESLLGEEGRGG